MIFSKARPEPATAVVTVPVKPDRRGEFSAWQAQMLDLVAQAPGYVSAEAAEPTDLSEHEYVTIYRFESTDALKAWTESPIRLQQVAAIADALSGPESTNIVVGKDTPGGSEVTAVINARVEPEAEEAYEEWQGRMAEEMNKQRGSLGTTVQRPIPGLQEEWVIMTRFDSEENLARWMQSKARKRMHTEIDGVSTSVVKKTRNSFDGWFNFKDGQRPPRAWQQSAIVLLVLFPTIVLEILFLSPYLNWMGLVPATFISNVVSVILTGFLLVPIAIWFFKWWIKPNIRPWILWVGTIIILALYVVLIIVMIGVASNVKIAPIANPF